VSLADQLKALKPNKEKAKAEDPNATLLDLFSGSAIKRKAEPVEVPETKKQKIKHEESSDSDSSDDPSSSSDDSSNESESPEADTSKIEEPVPTADQKPKKTYREVLQEEKEAEEAIMEERKATEMERNKSTIFIGNLPTKVTQRDLKKFFRKYGVIEHIRFRSPVVSSPKLPKKVSVITKQFNETLDDIHAYIKFQEESEAAAALEMNGELFMERHLRVDLASNNKKLNNASSVFLGNLPYDIDDESIWNHFGKCGKVSAVRVVRDPNYRIGKGFGYVMFDSPLAIKNALKLDQSQLKGRKIRVTKAIRDKKAKSTKEKHNLPLGTNKKKKPRITARSKNFQGKVAIEGKVPRLQLPAWKEQAKRKNAKTKKKLKQKKKNK